MKFAWPLAALVGLASAMLDANHMLNKHYEADLVSRGLMKRAVDDSYPPNVDDPYAMLTTTYPAYKMEVPIDHFLDNPRYAPHDLGMFHLRYWFDDRFYQPGGPVILMSAGEKTGESQLSYMQDGVLARMAMATNGMMVILEQRYYGNSVPTADFTARNMRFLTTEQSMADIAWFSQSIVFPGHEQQDLDSESAPWILYGSHYSGSLAAFTRHEYPNLFTGAITSSAITYATEDFGDYYDAARNFAPENCALNTHAIMGLIDDILLSQNSRDKGSLYRLFDLSGLTEIDFVTVLANGINSMIKTHWDIKHGSFKWDTYCLAMNSKVRMYKTNEKSEKAMRFLISEYRPMYNLEGATNVLANFIGWTDEWVISRCEGNRAECFSRPAYIYQRSSLEETWRPWVWQMCTEWGLFQTSTTPLPKGMPLISRLLTSKVGRQICYKSFSILQEPDTYQINQYGGLSFRFPRVAIINGEMDPWRAATPHKIGYEFNIPQDTGLYHLIPGAVHAWDKLSVPQDRVVPGEYPPSAIAETQSYEIWLVQQWVQEWAAERASRNIIPDYYEGEDAMDYVNKYGKYFVPNEPSDSDSGSPSGSSASVTSPFDMFKPFEVETTPTNNA
ncbi:putative serine protease EDA2 [Ceratocystis platani]|uniref:Putative serine protease EDA2 n=1 Tax=Ceratocystis fimbriata f. sp. platani TaxID=88771 RepID=A0A0F8DLE3_CERFI|nr:putative serine protease EDA2 [Ceratocystis platani]